MSPRSPSNSDVALKIAVVEDHDDLRELFVSFVGGMGHQVVGCALADELDEYLGSETPDLLILDLNLPGEDGYSIARRIRAVHPGMYILMLTARSTIEDRMRGYVDGADIYLTKPVSPHELAIVVENIERRLGHASDLGGQLSVNMSNLELRGPKSSQILTPPDFQLLKGLAEAPERQLPYCRLLEILALDLDDRGRRTLEVRISRLQKKLHAVGGDQPAIKSIWKEGYWLCVAVRFHA